MKILLIRIPNGFYFFLVFCLLVLFPGCLAGNNTGKHNKELCFKVTNIFPRFDNQGKLAGYDTANVYQYHVNDLYIYDLSYFSIAQSDSAISRQYRHHFIVYEKDSAYGYNYDYNQNPVKMRVNIDSAFRNEWVRINKIYPIMTSNLCTITSKKAVANLGLSIEDYNIFSKKDSTLIGQLHLEYKSKFPNTDLTLSSEFDSISQKKLIVAETRAEPRYFNEYKVQMSGYIIRNELAEIDIREAKELKRFLDQNKDILKGR